MPVSYSGPCARTETSIFSTEIIEWWISNFLSFFSSEMQLQMGAERRRRRRRRRRRKDQMRCERVLGR
jgi:hypothetical protein